ncbi:MFS transporter [Methylobrevis pamukkalensis]|uniref:Putative multidrug-efflux transporter n=1 Tax=Methylobrevis pamukkalensis TaxID=1439726 RepID=A0A1E3H2W1_9HYPH|nr:MFS transporter [Methylobrevis pamukkalensis]ODN70658.1 putative multidrug-efflux transporter [Methylobrevis pamukkalensis]
MLPDIAAGEGPATWRMLVDDGRAPATVMLCLGVGLYAFNDFIVTTTMPSAVLDLGSVHLISLAFSVFLVAAIVGGAAGGRIKQRFGARTALLAAAGLVAAGATVSASAPDMMTVIAGRVLTGLGEGVLAAICYALIPELFPSRLVPKIFGAEAVVWALAAFAGPLAGGLLAEHVSWRAAFLINLPLIALFAALVPQCVPRRDPATRDTSGQTLPLGRLGLVAAAILSASFAVLAGDAMTVAGLLGLALGGLALAVHLDRGAASRLFPRGAFGLRTPLGPAFWVVVLMPVGQATVAVYLALTMQQVFGYGAALAGFTVSILALAWSAAAIVVATLSRVAVSLPMIRLGPLLLFVGLAATAIGIPLGSQTTVILGQVLVGTGFGVNWAFLSHHVMAAAGREDRDLAAALLPTAQSAGYALGAALAGLVAAVHGIGEGGGRRGAHPGSAVDLCGGRDRRAAGAWRLAGDPAGGGGRGNVAALSERCC